MDVPDDFSFLPADDGILKPQETVRETMFFWGAAFRGAGVATRIHEAMQKAGIISMADVPVRQLSTGQKRRVNIARFFLRPAMIWLLDEPFNALDGAARRLFLAHMAAHGQVGGMTVIVSHESFDPPEGLCIRHLDMAS